MKRVVAVVVMSVLAVLGFTGTASALTPDEEALLEKCEAEFYDAVDEYVADFDEVQLDEFNYYWNDLITKLEDESISLDEFIAGMDELTDGLFTDVFIACLGDTPPGPVEPRQPATVPTSVPAGYEEPDTGAGVTAALVGLGLAAAAGVTLLARRALNHS
jgi:hypothetical protein